MPAHLTRRAAAYYEQAVIDAFAAEHLTPNRWSNAPGDVYAPHSHAYHKVLYCLRGSIVFTLTDTSESCELRPGDRLDIEPGTVHEAIVGPAGVTCIEAARP